MTTDERIRNAYGILRLAERRRLQMEATEGNRLAQVILEIIQSEKKKESDLCE